MHLQQWLEDRGAHPLPLFCLILAALAIWIAGKILFPAASIKSLNMADIEWLNEKPADAPKFVIADISARHVWSAAVTAQAFAFILALFFLTWSVFSPPLTTVIHSTHDCPLWRTCIVVGIALVLFVYVVAQRDSNEVPGGLSAAGKINSDFAKQAYALSKTTGLEWVTYISNGLAAAVICLGTLAVCATVARPRSFLDDSPPLLRKQVMALQSLLSACSTVMIVGVIQISVLYRWPAALIAKKEMRQMVVDLATASALGAGTCFGILLVSLFGGAAFVLWHRINSEVEGYERMNPGKDGHKALNLEFSLRDFYFQMAKALGPVFAAGIAAVINAKISE